MTEKSVKLTPHLIVNDARSAIDFYTKAFGAAERYRMPCPKTGKVLHADLDVGGATIFLCDAFPDMGSEPPTEPGKSPVPLHLVVDDVDVWMARAAEAGATVLMPATDMFWGDRFGKLVDPYNHTWTIATPKEALTPEQMQERMASEPCA